MSQLASHIIAASTTMATDATHQATPHPVNAVVTASLAAGSDTYQSEEGVVML